MNLCIFGEPGFGKTTLVEALTKVTEERLFGNGVDYTFREMNDQDEADLLTQADVAVLVSNTEGGLTDQSDELLSLAEELNVAHLAVFINKSAQSAKQWICSRWRHLRSWMNMDLKIPDSLFMEAQPGHWKILMVNGATRLLNF